jgi:hypothetical protein
VNRALVIEAARTGRISFYEGPTEEVTSGGMATLREHGVCCGCVWDADLGLGYDRCSIGEGLYRAATVAEVVAYMDAPEAA